MIAMATALSIPVCDLREAVLHTDILLYVDDRPWASESAQDPEVEAKDFAAAEVQAKTMDSNLAF